MRYAGFKFGYGIQKNTKSTVSKTEGVLDGDMSPSFEYMNVYYLCIPSFAILYFINSRNAYSNN